MKTTIRIGIVGLGSMGKVHVQRLLDGKVKGMELTAICDSNDANLALFPQVHHFRNLKDMLASKSMDAVLVVTPHPSHVKLGMQVLEAGYHLLMEKPIAVHVKEARLLAAAADKSGLCFAAMLNQRTDPLYQRLRTLISEGELGKVLRINWTATDWFRSDAYYRQGSWRATWEGEGGGMLLNQCPHTLDLWQWIFGMPTSIQAKVTFGKHHNIEVEDEATALMNYANGATGIFSASTGEAPGVNRLEVAAEYGLVIIEERVLTWKKIPESIAGFNQTNTDPTARPETTDITETYPDNGGQHCAILENFANHLLNGTPLLAPGVEGLHSLEMANSMILSSIKNRMIPLPMDDQEYAQCLEQLICEHRFGTRT
jgi:predicted dehydrogenase